MESHTVAMQEDVPPPPPPRRKGNINRSNAEVEENGESNGDVPPPPPPRRKKNVVEKVIVEKVKVVAAVAKVAVVPSFVPRSLAPSKSKKMSSNGAKSVEKSSGSVEKEKVVDSEAALLDSFLSSV